MAGGVEVTGARGTRPTGHGSKNRGHREKEGEQGNSARLTRRPEDTAEATVAMAGGESTWAHAAKALETSKLKINGMGR